jgi:predicted protein tyrosine phosphatase
MENQIDYLTLFSSSQEIPANVQIRLRPGNEGAYQRWLFVDDAGLIRSPTAAYLAGKADINARAAGAVPQQSLIPLRLQLTNWAQTVVFLDQESYDNTMTLFTPYESDRLSLQAKSRILNIPNEFSYRQPELVTMLLEQIPELTVPV